MSWKSLKKLKMRLNWLKMILLKIPLQMNQMNQMNQKNPKTSLLLSLC